MSRWHGKVTVTLKSSVNDPQGLAVYEGLKTLGFEEVTSVRVGKHIDVLLDSPTEEDARRRLAEMCESLLANTIIETYKIEVSKGE